MSKLSKHIIFPALAPLALIIISLIPADNFGFANRGFISLGLVLFSTLAATITSAKGLSLRRKGVETYSLWLISSLILILPAALLLGPLK